jgi:hypothetical protein
MVNFVTIAVVDLGWGWIGKSAFSDFWIAYEQAHCRGEQAKQLVIN